MRTSPSERNAKREAGSAARMLRPALPTLESHPSALHLSPPPSNWVGGGGGGGGGGGREGVAHWQHGVEEVGYE